MEKTFTPGPWEAVAPVNSYYGEPGDRAIAAYVNGTKRIVAEAFVKVSSEDNLDATANANLIASAPDLYDALEAALGPVVCWANHYGDDVLGHNHPEHDALIEQVKAALAKARGEA